MTADPLDCHENLMYLVRSARITAHQFGRRIGLRRQEEEDLMGELMLRAVQKRHLFDPERATWKTWVSRVLPNAAKNFCEARIAARRDDRLTVMMPSA